MSAHAASLDRFPCPFCRSTRVFLIGSGRTFLHYRCPDCSEVWTAMRHRSDAESVFPEPPRAAELKH